MIQKEMSRFVFPFLEEIFDFCFWNDYDLKCDGSLILLKKHVSSLCSESSYNSSEDNKSELIVIWPYGRHRYDKEIIKKIEYDIQKYKLFDQMSNGYFWGSNTLKNIYKCSSCKPINCVVFFSPAKLRLFFRCKHSQNKKILKKLNELYF
jgi:hypothetical protein